jgi:hypothetical protein
MAKRMAEQMELFEPVERGFNEGGDTSSAKDTAMQDLQSSAEDKKATRQDQFDKLTDMLMSGEIKDMPEEKQKKFINLYKMMKSQGFNEGGLMDEGGMVDEESGNEVPPGSLREEVRDDIPAQLSEGEFVFPADVVRYIGLENLMRMRQEAKQGLSQMEAMGQMGNSEEAVVQDDLPFDMYDLDVDEEEEYNSETKNYQVGGYVPPSVPQQPYNQPTQVDPRTGTYTLPGTGIAGYQVPSGGQTGYTSYGGATPYFQPVQFTGPQFQTALQTTNLPTFAETVGSKPGQYDELRTYINDAGQTLQIPFKDGRPIYPIPEGYRPIGDQPAPEEAPTTVTPTLGQTQVREIGGDNSTGMDGKTPGGMFGGNANTLKSSAYTSAVTNLGLSQLTSLSPTVGLMGAITGKPTANDVAIASNTARNTVVNAFGLTDVSAASVSELDAIGSAMNVVSNFTSIGQTAPTELAAATVAKSIADAIKTNKMSVEQADTLSGLGMDSSGALTDKNGNSAYNEDDPGTVNPDFDPEALDAINAYAEAMATDDDEDDEADDAAAAAQAAKDAGVTTGQGIAGIESQGVAPGPGAPAASDKGKEGGSMADRGGGPGVGGGDNADGSKGGGAVGGGCFEKGTLFKMADGTTKCVEDIKPGDKMYKGGLVYAVMQGDGLLEDWYDYKGIHVTSAHPVLDKGTWKRVGETSSKKAIDKREIYYSLMNINHLMIAENGTEFTDFVEISADIGGRGEWMMEMLNQKQAA